MSMVRFLGRLDCKRQEQKVAIGMGRKGEKGGTEFKSRPQSAWHCFAKIKGRRSRSLDYSNVRI